MQWSNSSLLCETTTESQLCDQPATQSRPSSMLAPNQRTMSFTSSLLRAAARTACNGAGSSIIMRAGGRLVPAMNQAVTQAAKATSGMGASLATVSQMQRSLHKPATTFASSLLRASSTMQPCAVPSNLPTSYSPSATLTTDSTAGSVSTGHPGAGGALDAEEDSESNSTERPHIHSRLKRPPDKIEDASQENVYVLSRWVAHVHGQCPCMSTHAICGTPRMLPYDAGLSPACAVNTTYVHAHVAAGVNVASAACQLQMPCG